ncbi:MAG: helix-turn-helix transcriptional regulator [Pyrinomonadaceae bacterium]
MLELSQKEYLGERNLLDRGSGGISVVEVEYRNEVFEGWHSHRQPHITLFLQGGTIEKRKTSERVFGFGDLAFYHGGEPHQNYKTSFPSKNINLELDEVLLERLGITEAMIERSIADKVSSKLLILKIYHECLIADELSEDTKQMLVAQFAPGANYFEGFANCPTWVRSLFEILNDRWHETPKLSELGKVLGLNPITISKHFPRYFGCSFGEYLRRLKVDQALTLIRNGRSSLTQIAHDCGFSDQSHFVRTFKHQTGFLPRQFQRL